MVKLSREKIQRMVTMRGGSSSGGGGGSDIAGGVTQAWVNQNYVSIEFFRKVFKVWAAGETSSDPDVEIMPNDIASTVKDIQAQAGLWTEQFLSALGNGSGGGTGGASSLDQLDDVVITSPTNGQALIYNATTQMWVNGTIQSGTDMVTVWSALAAATNEQINASHLSGVLADYVTTTSLQTILGDYLTQTSADQRYITIAYFDRLFRAYNGSTLVSHNDTTTTIDNIKAMFGFWTDMYLSALGRNSAATGLGIDNLTDVTINNPTDGQVLQYNANSSKWENATIQTVVALSGLTDVLLTTPADGEFLMYDSSEGKWVNMPLKTINSQSLIGSGDISVGGGASGNYLPLTGGTLTNPNWRGQLTINRESDRDSVVAFTNSDGMLGCLGFSGSSGLPCYWSGTNGTGIPLASQEWSDGRYLPLSGGTLTGTLNITNSSRLYVGDNAILRVREYSTTVNFIEIVVTSGTSSHTNDRPLVFQSGYGNVGIGDNDAPSYKLDVNGTGRFTDTLLVGSILFERANEINNTSGSGNLHLLRRTAGDITMAYGGGNVGIGGLSPSYKLHVAGTIYATGAITALSDARKKDVTGEAGVTVDQIAHAPAVQFLWKDKERRKDGQQVGTLAQYWQTVLPEVVMDKGGELSMQYGVAALVSAIITARKVVDHEQRIRLLEKENEELKKQLNAA